MQAVIDRHREIVRLKLLESVDTGLGQQTLAAMRRWRFEPAKLADGQPVAVYYTLTMDFDLEWRRR